MNFQLSNTTTVPQAILIRHWHNYFENGQTRRIKNLTYSLMPVDHNAIVRKTLLRKGAEGYRALIVFAELMSIATRSPQRGLVVDVQEPITAERITGATGMSETEVRSVLELLASKYLKWISHVACHNAQPSTPNPTAVACHTQTPTLDPQNPVACHTEHVAIQEDSIAATKKTDLEVRKMLELIASKYFKWISHVAYHSAQPSSPKPTAVACHTQTPTLALKYLVAGPKKLIVSGSLRTGRKGKPLQPELIHLDNPPAPAPDLRIEWEYLIVDKGSGPETERRLPTAPEKPLSADKEGVKEVETVACHTQTPTLAPQHPVACHRATPPSSNPSAVACHTEAVAIQKDPTAATTIKKPTTPSERRKTKFLRRQQAQSRKR
jgi:hypothetical protein